MERGECIAMQVECVGECCCTGEFKVQSLTMCIVRIVDSYIYFVQTEEVHM